MRNAALLEEFLRVRGEENLTGGGKAISERATVTVRCRPTDIRWQSINWVEQFRRLLASFSAVISQVLVAAGARVCKKIQEVSTLLAIRTTSLLGVVRLVLSDP